MVCALFILLRYLFCVFLVCFGNIYDVHFVRIGLIDLNMENKLKLIEEVQWYVQAS